MSNTISTIVKARITYLEEQRKKLTDIKSIIEMALQDVDQEFSIYNNLNLIYQKRINPDVVIDFDKDILPVFDQIKVEEIKKLPPQNPKRKGIIKHSLKYIESSNIPFLKGRKQIDNKKISEIIREKFKTYDSFNLSDVQDFLLEKYPDINKYWNIKKGIMNTISKNNGFKGIQRGTYKIDKEV